MNARNAIKTVAFFCLAVIAMALFASVRTYAADAAYADWLPGSWLGMARTSKGRSFMVKLTADQAKPDKVTVRFGPPADCQMSLNRPKQDGGAVVFNTFSTSGGICDRYLPGNAQVQQGDDKNMLIFTLTGRSDTDKLKLMLRRGEGTAAATAPAPKSRLGKKNKTE